MFGPCNSFVLEIVILLITDFQLTMPTDDVLKLLVSCGLQVMPMSTCGIKTQGPNRRHWCGTGQEPSEGLVSE